ncbi:hypothetical protein FACS189430_00210 [Bacteroidia bacterium]|nr:hypothetical protein FACS189430_00210 [Bacteroidia bacterium]
MNKVKHRKHITGLTLLIFIFGMNVAWAQKAISINSEKTFLEQRIANDVLRSRTFEANPALQNFSQSNIGDTLLLDFFGDKRYKAVVLQVGKSYDGIIGITTQVANTQFGYCYISIAGNDIALSAELPQKDEFFSIRKINGQHCLTEQKLSEMQHEHSDECSHAAEHSGSKRNAVLRSVIPSQPESFAAVTVDVLVVYTPAAKAETLQNGKDIDLEINAGIQKSNQVLSNSNTNVTLNIVYKQEVDYTESSSPNTDLDRLRDPQDGYADEAHALRSRYNADLVVFLLGESGSNVAGAGYILSNDQYGGNPKSGFSVIKVKHVNTTGYVLIHEIGHNFGCGHHVNTDANNLSKTSLYSYSRGYAGTSSLGGFSTIMTYENVGGVRIPYFSDPTIMYDGVAVGDANANNAKTIRQTKELIAAYDNEIVYTDAFLKDITLSSGILSPSFNPGVYQYTVNVSNNVANIDVQSIANSQYATVTGNVTAKPLTVGSNTVVIEVEDAWRNYQKKPYTVTVNRSASALSKDANLSSLSVNQGTLTPAFNANTTSYSVNVANSVANITISATANHSAANVVGTGSQSLKVGNNALSVVVTAEDGATKKTYTVNITRAALVVQSNDANLSSLSVNQGTLTPAFNANTTSYSVNVANSVANITISATAKHNAASVVGTGSQSLKVGNNSFNVVVTAEDGATKKTYTVNITRAAPVVQSNDSNLSSLSVNQGTLTPAFNANTTSYSVNVANSVANITISATANHSAANVVGTGSQSLKVGNNSFNVVVTAEDGTSKKTYTVNITRAALVVQSNDANLSSLSVNQGTLTPAFNANTTSYSVSVANSVANITISATANHSAASVVGTGSQSLNVGNNALSVVVTAEDGTSKTYTVTVNRAAATLSKDANLSNLTVNQGTLTPNFASGTTAYTVNVVNTVTNITLTATTVHSGATVAGDGAKSLTVGKNILKIVVTAEDGAAKKTYTVTVNRATATLSKDANLRSLSVNQGTLTPVFNVNTTSYSVNVAHNVTSITISATANHNCCKCDGTGSKSLNVGNNSFDVVCTAEDGTVKTYTVTVNRDTSTAVETVENSGIKVWSANGMIHIDSPSEEIALIKVYDLTGKLIKTVKTKTHQFETANPYEMQLAIIVIETSRNKTYSQKVILY